ncbi:glycosyl transferase [Alphaproteobacteria bacterium KMM 3653]|uniref:Peptide O-xylosyltransferase n=1 Tax=Harenicola maris TaxID=2841044 RepID=A0AAP2CQ23_9RHOB|nr:glycosyl transferase [Harenicola maris]
MSIGFIMMVHTALDRVSQTARHWASSGCPIVIHCDKSVPKKEFEAFTDSLADLENVSFTKRYRCEWGTWPIVAATIEAAQQMLKTHPDVGHVFLASGSCLPLRPVQELRAYLEARPRTDFIESVTVEDVTWTKGGFDSERFALRFPFSWRSQRYLFDRYVALQRLFKFRRRVPENLTPHLGSQWWCLSRATLSAILNDPNRASYDRYFKRVWIPDESYFQSLVRLHSKEVESRSLTLSKFDFQGKPHIFYDDHLQLLRRSDCFVARKIWPHATKLYASFLSNDPSVTKNAEPNPSKIDRLFSKAVDRRTLGRPGLYMQSRFPNNDWENGKTCQAYSVFGGFSDVFVNFETWLSKTVGGRVHGNLFAPDRVHFAGGDTVYNGCLSDSALTRDQNPKAFLTSLIWNTRGERQCFQYSPADSQDIAQFMASDPNAQISVVTGAWAVRLFQTKINSSVIRKEAARLQTIEAKFLDVLRSPHCKARVRIWTLADFVEAPMEHLQEIIDETSPRSRRRLNEAPRMADLDGFGRFLQTLKNQGMNPYLAGDFPVGSAGTVQDSDPQRPYLVK